MKNRTLWTQVSDVSHFKMYGGTGSRGEAGPPHRPATNAGETATPHSLVPLARPAIAASSRHAGAGSRHRTATYYWRRPRVQRTANATSASETATPRSHTLWERHVSAASSHRTAQWLQPTSSTATRRHNLTAHSSKSHSAVLPPASQAVPHPADTAAEQHRQQAAQPRHAQRPLPRTREVTPKPPAEQTAQ